MFIPNYKIKQNGYSLLGMLVYVSILAIITSLSMNALFSTINAFADVRVSRDVNDSATTAMERMVFEIRTAISVDQAESTFGTHPGGLTLNTKDAMDADTTVEFYISSNMLRIKEGGNDAGALTPSSVVVDNLQFNLITTTNTEAVRIQMQLTATRGTVTKTRMFYDTITLRGGY